MEDQNVLGRKLIMRWGIFVFVLITGVTLLLRPRVSHYLFGDGMSSGKSIVLLDRQNERPSLHFKDAIQHLRKQKPVVLGFDPNSESLIVPIKIVMDVANRRGKFPSMLFIETDGRFRDEVFEMFDIRNSERERLNHGMKDILAAATERAVSEVEPQMVGGLINELRVPAIKDDTTNALRNLLEETSIPQDSRDLMLNIFQGSNLRGWERPGVLRPVRDADGNVSSYEYRVEVVKGKWIVDREFTPKVLSDEANNLSYKYLIAILDKYWQ